MANKISKQFKTGITTPNIKVSFLLLVVTHTCPMHCRFVSPFEADKEMIVNRFVAAGISDAIKNAQGITEKTENSFKELYFFFF